MTATATAAEASTTIARLACRYALAGDDRDGPAVRARLDAVAERRLTAAVAAALTPLDDADRGAVWVVRRLRASARVSAQSEDLDLLARQWGSQLAEAILATLRGGPGADVMRFGSRAEYLAAYVAARCRGVADGWVFASLRDLNLLTPATALRAAAGSGGVSVTEVVAELAVRRRLEALLATSGPGALRLLWHACLAEGPVRPPATLGAQRVAEIAATLGPSVVAGPQAARGLRLFGALVAELGADVATAAAADAHESAVSPAGVVEDLGSPVVMPADRRAASRGTAVTDERPAAAGRALDPRSREPPSPAPPDLAALDDTELFAAAGAQAFMLSTSLEAVGLGGVPAATRVAVLCRLLGCSADRAVLLAGGAPLDEPLAPARDGGQLLDVLLAALVDNRRVDGRWVVADVVAHPDGSHRVALLRDAVTDLWVGGAIVGAGDEPPWPALVERAEAALGQRVRRVSLPGGDDSGGAAARPDRPAELGAALAALRPAAPDVAWLAPADDDDLAAGLAARATLRHLARRLLGFDRATMSYLVERFLPPGGVVTVEADRIHADLPPSPLGVVLTMAGLETFTYRVGWLTREVLVTHRRG